MTRFNNPRQAMMMQQAARQPAQQNRQAFGHVSDEQPDYWKADRLHVRDAQLLDRHFTARFQGQTTVNGRDPSIRQYAIPKSQQVALRESPNGGIPVFQGGASNWDSRYLQAQTTLLGKNLALPDPLMGQQGYGEVDIGQVLQNRMVSQAARPPVPNHGPMPGHNMAMGQQEQPRVCQLAEGFVYYSALEGSFGTTMPLVRKSGQLQGIQGRQFQIESVVTCYVVDGLQTIDLQRQDPQRLVSLVRVSAGMGQSYLVPQQAVMEMGGGGGGRSLLIDNRSNPRQQAQMQAQMHQQQLMMQQQQANQRGLLLNQRQPQQQMQQPQNPRQNVQQMGMDVLRRRGLIRG